MRKYLIAFIIISLFIVGCSKDEVVPIVETQNKTTVSELVNETPVVNETIEEEINETVVNMTQAINETKVTANTVTVKITSTGFDPKEVRIKKGTMVIWTQNDDKIRNAKHQLSGFYSSFRQQGYLFYGGSYNHTFNTNGTFEYIDVLHRTFKGMIIVED